MGRLRVVMEDGNQLLLLEVIVQTMGILFAKMVALRLLRLLYGFPKDHVRMTRLVVWILEVDNKKSVTKDPHSSSTQISYPLEF